MCHQIIEIIKHLNFDICFHTPTYSAMLGRNLLLFAGWCIGKNFRPISRIITLHKEAEEAGLPLGQQICCAKPVSGCLLHGTVHARGRGWGRGTEQYHFQPLGRQCFSCLLLVFSSLEPEESECKNTDIILVSPFSLPVRLNGFASTTTWVYKITQKYVKEKCKVNALAQWN